MNTLQERYVELKSHVAELIEKSGRNSAVTMIAVSKFQPVESIEILYHLGQRDFGENYVQELLEKDRVLREKGIQDIRWHFIGHLQRNKVKALLPIVDILHTVDSLELATEIAKRWRSLDRQQKVKIFLEVNLHSEPSKAGFDPSQLKTNIHLIAQIQELEILGLMCIPDPLQDPGESFAALREIELSYRPLTHCQLSMGMSSDYAVAIQEGATHIRVGTSLFGARQRPSA